MTMGHLSTLLNGILVGASGYAMYCIVPNDNPYAFSACAIGLCHGLLGFITSIQEDSECTKVYQVSASAMEIVPLPLVNIELYMASQSNALALGHGLFIIPLTFDMIAKLFTDSGEDSSTETLKDLTIIGNIVSLLFLSVNEENYLYGAMAFSALIAKYGALAIDSFWEGSADNIMLVGYSAFYVLLSQVIPKPA